MDVISDKVVGCILAYMQYCIAKRYSKLVMLSVVCFCSFALSTNSLDYLVSARFDSKKIDVALKSVQEFEFSAKNLQAYLKILTAEAHPFGSPRQKYITDWLVNNLKQQNVYLKTQLFSAKVPALNSFGQRVVASMSKTERIGSRERGKWSTFLGRNVIAKIVGGKDCSVVVGSHYDTKQLYHRGVYLGANDSGSSTAAMLELVRYLSNTPLKSHLCDVYAVFFDGEESVFYDWDDGEKLLGRVDHTYGSRYMASQLIKQHPNFHVHSQISYSKIMDHGSAFKLERSGKYIHAVMILDMIGSQNVRITDDQNSDADLAKLMHQAARKLKLFYRLSKKKRFVEDDHIPFRKIGIPVLLMIDFENTAHWHKPSDTLDTLDINSIIDILRIATYTLHMMSMSDQNRVKVDF